MFNLQETATKYGAEFKSAFVYPGLDAILGAVVTSAGVPATSSAVAAAAEFKKLCKETLKMDYVPKSTIAAEMLISHGILPIDPEISNPAEVLAQYKLSELATPPQFPRTCCAFTDGASYKNGKPGARASYSAVMGPYSQSGLVEPFEYESGRPIRPTTVAAAPSNNRGELLGFMYGLLLIRKYGLMSEKAFLISDSEYSIKTVTQYYPARLRKKTESELKNLDLLKIIYPIYMELKALVDLTIMHVRSHQKTTACNFCNKCENCEYRAGNELADKLAGLALIGGGVEYSDSLNNI